MSKQKCSLSVAFWNFPWYAILNHLFIFLTSFLLFYRKNPVKTSFVVFFFFNVLASLHSLPTGHISFDKMIQGIGYKKPGFPNIVTGTAAWLFVSIFSIFLTSLLAWICCINVFIIITLTPMFHFNVAYITFLSHLKHSMTLFISVPFKFKLIQ